MIIKRSKIVIIGAGNVGTTTAFCIVNQGLCDELVLIDVNEDKAYGEVLDLQHSISFMNRNIRVRCGDYAECADADIVVITASAPMVKGDHDRLEMLERSMEIIKGITESVMVTGFDGIFILVSNPVDVMSYYVWKLSGLPSSQIIGSGTTLDTARLRYYIGNKIDVDQRSINAYVIGEHGDSEFIPWSTATIGGKTMSDVIKDNVDRIGLNPYESFRKDTVNGGWEIFSRKGNTSYGIGSSTTRIIKTILQDESHIYPVSVLLNGEYGVNDVFISVPTIIDRSGVKEIVELKLNDEEQKEFMNSVEVLKKTAKKLKY